MKLSQGKKMVEPAINAKRDFLSAEQYLAFEKSSEIRHEYVDGVLYAMVGATVRHAMIVGNIFAALRALLPSSCSIFANDLKAHIKTKATERFYYPDLVISCAPQDQNSYVCRDPSIIFEILSPSTSRTDRTEKFEAYRQIESLQHYVLVHQAAAQVELYSRNRDWQRQSLAAGEELSLSSPAFTIAIDEFFSGVVFEEEQE